MRLSAVPQSCLVDVSRPFAGEQRLSVAAQQEASLVDAAQSDSYVASPDLKSKYTQASRSAKLTGAIIGGAAAVAYGVVAAASLGAFPLLLAGGALVGAALEHFGHQRHNSGQVTVVSQGQQRVESFVIDPSQFRKTNQELRLIETAKGNFGDQIAASPIQIAGKADPAILASLDQHRSALLELGKERRLVADLGHQSSYGHQVLDLVDAANARKILATGASVYLVSGKECQDVNHDYQSLSASTDGKVKYNESHQVVERRFSYELSELRELDQLEKASNGLGLPASFNGIYKNSDLTPMIVARDNQTNWARLDGKVTSRNQTSDDVRLDASVAKAAQLPKATVPLTHGDTNAGVAFAVAGGMLGVGLAAVTGLPHLVCFLPAVAMGALGYHKFDGFLRASQGLSEQG